MPLMIKANLKSAPIENNDTSCLTFMNTREQSEFIHTYPGIDKKKVIFATKKNKSSPLFSEKKKIIQLHYLFHLCMDVNQTTHISVRIT